MPDESKADKLDGEIPLKGVRSRGRPHGAKTSEEVKVREAGDMAKNSLLGRAIKLYEAKSTVADIARELQLSPPTINKWLVEAGVKPKPGAEEAEFDPKLQKQLEDEHNDTGRAVAEKSEEDLLYERLDGEATKDVVASLTPQQKQDILTISAQIARDMEQDAIEEGSSTELSVADQYQAYAANLGIKLLRDSRTLIRGPRTVKELNDLDQFIRRNLGLNPRGDAKAGAGPQGNLIVDVKILNNPMADLVKSKEEEAVIVDMPDE